MLRHLNKGITASLINPTTSLLVDNAFAPVIVYSTLQALLSAIPTFWTSPEVLSVLTLHIEDNIAGPTPTMAALVKTLTKRVSPKILLPSILELWTKPQTTSNDVSPLQHGFSHMY